MSHQICQPGRPLLVAFLAALDASGIVVMARTPPPEHVGILWEQWTDHVDGCDKCGQAMGVAMIEGWRALAYPGGDHVLRPKA